MAAEPPSGHVLLCVTDHESASATAGLLSQLEDSNYQVKLILASGAKPFVKNFSLDRALDDESEWYAWKKACHSKQTLRLIGLTRDFDCESSFKFTEEAQFAQVGDEVLHIELTRWADVVIIVPCSANYLAKIANGLCDDLVMSVIRAWPPEKPVLIQLAMHAAMWQHPQTCEQLYPLNRQPNLYFVGAHGDAREALDCKVDRPEYNGTCAGSVISSLQQLLKGAP